MYVMVASLVGSYKVKNFPPPESDFQGFDILFLLSHCFKVFLGLS